MFGQQGQGQSAPQQSTFSFGTKTTGTGSGTAPTSFAFGTNTSSSLAAGFQGFSFGGSTLPSTAGGGIRPTGTAASGTGFSVGAPTGPTALAKPSFNFGQTISTPSTTTGSQPCAPVAPGGFTFGGAAASFAAPVSKPTGTATSFSFASQPQTQKQQPTNQPIVFGQAATQATAPTLAGGTGFSLQKTASVPAATPTASSAGFGLTGISQPFTVPPITTAKVVPTAATQSGLATGLPAIASTSGFKLGGATTTASMTASTGFSFGALSTATSTAASSSAGVIVKPLTSTIPAGATKQTEAPLSYKQLEELVNKWVHELEDQERMFLNQASQVNTWDRLLIENGEKITELHSEVERVKSEQKRLDRELDFILSQQQDLEEILQPLEEQLKSQQGMQYLQHADLEREKTYKMAENVDGQLKRMTQDLREVIEHINCSNVNTRETEDPMTQIAKILNAHMDSLQWVDQNTTLVQRRVEDVNKQMEARKRDHERTVRLSFD